MGIEVAGRTDPRLGRSCRRTNGGSNSERGDH
jgi:hypothetical protein